MITLTFRFITDGHASISVVTAETEVDVKEKYFMKYPERKDDPRLTWDFGDTYAGFPPLERRK